MSKTTNGLLQILLWIILLPFFLFGGFALVGTVTAVFGGIGFCLFFGGLVAFLFRRQLARLCRHLLDADKWTWR